MKKNFMLSAVFITILGLAPLTYAENSVSGNNAENVQATAVKSTTIKNSLFSITLPENIKDSYIKSTSKDSIMIYHKDSKQTGFGGFAFGIKAYKNPNDYAQETGTTKIGELTDKKRMIYDVVLLRPTDVQYDSENDMPKSYEVLYNLADNIKISGNSGSVYYKNKGTKGKDLYKDVIKKHITSIREKWDSKKLTSENMSNMYNVTAQIGKDVLNKIGYAYYDINNDGIEELLIGEISTGENKGIIYDIYTMVDRKPNHVVSGNYKNRYFVCNDYFVCDEFAEDDEEYGTIVYFLTENTTNLLRQLEYRYDEKRDKEKPWFVSYGIDKGVFEYVSKEVFYEKRNSLSKYKKFDFIPLSEFEQ